MKMLTDSAGLVLQILPLEPATYMDPSLRSQAGTRGTPCRQPVSSPRWFNYMPERVGGAPEAGFSAWHCCPHLPSVVVGWEAACPLPAQALGTSESFA